MKIAIDGPAGAGKSTVAKALAKDVYKRQIASRAYGSMMEITKSHLRAKYSHAKGGLSILSIMEVKPNVNIPELTKKVSELIKQDVEQYTRCV